MNVSEHIKELQSQVTRLTGKQFEETLSEAEILQIIQELPSFADQSKSFEVKLAELELSFSTQLNDVIEQMSKVAGTFEELKSGITPEEMNTAIKSAIEPVKKEFSGKIQVLNELAEAYKKPAGSDVDATIEQTEKDEKVQKKSAPIKIAGRVYESK